MEGLQKLEGDVGLKKLTSITYGQAKIEVYRKGELLVLYFSGEKRFMDREPFEGKVYFTPHQAVELLFGVMGIQETKEEGKGGKVRVLYDYEKELLKLTVLDDKRYSRYYLNPAHHLFFLSGIRNYIISLPEILFFHKTFMVEVDRERKVLRISEGAQVILERRGKDFLSLRAVLENTLFLGEESEFPQLDKTRSIFTDEVPALAIKVWSVL